MKAEEYRKVRVTTKGLTLEERVAKLNTTKEEVVKLYKENYTVHQIMHHFGFYEQDVRSILSEASINTKSGTHPVTVKQCIANTLNPNGWTEEKLKRLFCDENLRLPQIHDLMSQELGESAPSFRLLERIIKHYSLKKTTEQVKELQGLKSRLEKATNLERLDKIGHTPESAALLYEGDRSITWLSLVNHFNELLGDDKNPFTEKWLTKTLSPHFSEEFKKITRRSREELNFQAWLENIYSGTIGTGDSKVIAPYELDFVLPELNLAVEFNGDYWHSDEFLLTNHGMTSEAYHNNKKVLAAASGYNLVFAWESDWRSRREEVETAVELLLTSKTVSPILDRLS